MKRRMVCFLGIVMVSMLIAGCQAKAKDSQDTDGTGDDPKKAVSAQAESVTIDSVAPSEEKSPADEAAVTEDEAKEIALTDAGLKEDQTSGIRIRLERDDGILQYEVSLYAGNKEYDYDIDAASGKILSKDMDIEDDFQRSGANSGDAAISEAEAKKRALKEVPGAGDSDIRIHLDHDDGKAVYEGSIVYKERKYEFEIDANSGDILEWEDESVYD